jgi:hypothetical protein
MKSEQILSTGSPFGLVKNEIQNILVSSVGLNKDLTIPTVNMLINAKPELGQFLLDEFRSRGGVDEGQFGKVEYQIKLWQGALLSSLLVGYHKPSGKWALYTASQKIISEVNPSLEFSLDKIYKNNVEGILHALRLDIEYTSKSDFEAKLVRLNVKTNIVANEYILVPIESFVVLSEIIKGSLAKGDLLFTMQTLGGIRKDRFITRNATILDKYSDSKAFAQKVSNEVYSQPLSLKLYCPVVGATSNTTGLTALHLLNLDKLAKVKDNGKLVEVSSFGGNIRMVVITLLTNWLYSIYGEETLEQYNSYVESLVDVIGQKMFLDYVNEIKTPKNMPEDAIISLEGATRIIRDLTDEDLQSLWTTYKEKGMVTNNPQELVKLVSEKYNHLGNQISKEDLKSKLSNGLLKVVTTKKDGSFTTMYVTNDSNILARVYGENYLIEFESLGVRIRMAKHYLEQGELTFDEVMEYLGFEELIGKGAITAKENLEIFENYVSNDSGYTPRKSNSNENLVLARRVFGVVGPSGIEGYYCNIDVTKIHEIVEVY